MEEEKTLELPLIAKESAADALDSTATFSDLLEKKADDTVEFQFLWWKRLTTREKYSAFWEFAWTFNLASLAAVLTYWPPLHYVWPEEGNSQRGIDITTFLYNVTGAFLVGVISALEKVKYQYMQKYLIYSGIKGGFSSVWTSFGNYIQDCGRLLINDYAYVMVINTFGTLIVAFLLWELGRLIVLKVKSTAKYTDQLVQLESADKRMEHETELDWEDAHQSRKRTKLAKHFQRRFAKKEKHSRLYMTKWQRYACIFIAAVPAICYFPLFIVNPPDSYAIRNWNWYTNWVMCVVGALVGGYLGDNKGVKKDVHWGTFKVNMISCILIGTAYNLLFFRQYFGSFGLSQYFYFLMINFMYSFCGSESSFAGLIDETMTLFHANEVPKSVAAKNLFFNLFICMCGFFFVIFGVRILIFFRSFSPESISVYF